jgi:hypothetical protein
LVVAALDDALVAAVLLFLVFFAFFAFLAVAVVLVLVLPVLEVAGACAAKISGMVANANPIASNVFFMFPFSLERALFSLTVSWCGLTEENSIACPG